MTVDEIRLSNEITSAISDKATEQRLHHFMPRSTSIVTVPDRGVKEYHCIYTFVLDKYDDCLKRNFGFGIDLVLCKNMDEIVNQAIEIIRKYHDENKEEIYKKIIN